MRMFEIFKPKKEQDPVSPAQEDIAKQTEAREEMISGVEKALDEAVESGEIKLDETERIEGKDHGE